MWINNGSQISFSDAAQTGPTDNGRAYIECGTGKIHTDSTISTTSNDNWDLNDYTATTVAATGFVTVTINGTDYKLLTRLE